MKFMISLNSKKLKTLFRLAGDYINACVERRLVVMFSSAQGLFVMSTINTSIMEDYDSSKNVFRIPRTGFFNLLDDGTVTFLCGEDKIYVKFDNSKMSYSMSFDRQICSDPGLEEKIDILRNVKQYPRFPASDLILPTKLLRGSVDAITIEDGIAFSSVSGLNLYAKTKCSNCAVFPQPLGHLLTMCNGDFDNIYAVRDYIVYTDGEYHVIVNKVTPRFKNDVKLIMRRPVTYRTTVDFKMALSLLLRVKDYKDVKLDLAKQELVIKSKGCEYSTRVELKDNEDGTELETLEEMLAKEEVVIPSIEFTAEVFGNIIAVSKTKSLEIFCTDRFVRVSIAPGLMFVCRRS